MKASSQQAAYNVHNWYSVGTTGSSIHSLRSSLCEKHERVVSLQRTWIGGDVICAGEATAKAPVLSALVPQAVRCTQP